MGSSRHRGIQIRFSSDGSVYGRTRYSEERPHNHNPTPEAGLDIEHENGEYLDSMRFYGHLTEGFYHVRRHELEDMEVIRPSGSMTIKFHKPDWIPGICFIIHRAEEALGIHPRCDGHNRLSATQPYHIEHIMRYNPQRVVEAEVYVDGSMGTHSYWIDDRTHESEHDFAEYLEIGEALHRETMHVFRKLLNPKP